MPQTCSVTLVGIRAGTAPHLAPRLHGGGPFRLIEEDGRLIEGADPLRDRKQMPPRCEIIVLGDAADAAPMPVAIARLRAGAPSARILVLSEHSAGETILAALRAGAAGYVVAPTSAERVVEALEALRRGECPLSPLATRRLVESLNRPAPAPPPAKLSGREKEVFELLVRGLRYREIAESLFISIETVRSHIRRIYRKLAVSSRAELTAQFLLHQPAPSRG